MKVYVLIDNDWRHGDSIICITASRPRAEAIKAQLEESGKADGIEWHDMGTSIGITISEREVVE